MHPDALPFAHGKERGSAHEIWRGFCYRWVNTVQVQVNPQSFPSLFTRSMASPPTAREILGKLVTHVSWLTVSWSDNVTLPLA
jgi:hypothetical protein